jgi:3'-phosphoadenosine 5'-phosphosulfate (PAPS) 3'-phosphatase
MCTADGQVWLVDRLDGTQGSNEGEQD